MSRAEKAKWRKNVFIQYFIDDPFFGENYVENEKVYIGGKRTSVRNILRGYKRREMKDEKEEVEEIKS
jgi:hypothetical protein